MDTRTQDPYLTWYTCHKENKIRNKDNISDPTKRDGSIDSIVSLSGEMNARLSQEVDSPMSMMETEVHGVIRLAINDSVMPEVQVIGNLPLD